MNKLRLSMFTLLLIVAIPALATPEILAPGQDAQYISSLSGNPGFSRVHRDTVIIGVLDLKATNVDAGEVEVISERLRFYIGNQPVFQLIERAEMFRIMEEVGFQQLGACDDEECLVQVGRILGAKKMIAGSIGRVGSTYSLHVRLVDIESSQIEHQVFQDVSDVEEILRTATKAVAEELARLMTPSVEPVPSDPVIEPETPPQPVVTETIETNPWITKATHMSGRGFLSAGGVVDGKLVCIEEIESAGGAFCIVQVYDPATLRWSQNAAFQSSLGRNTASTGAIDGKLYIAGGRGRVVFTKRLRIYDLESDIWSTGASMPSAASEGAAGVINGTLYVAGGTSSLGVLNVLRTYNPESDAWAIKATMPTARRNAAAAAIDGKLYVIGGTAAGGRILSSLEVYDPATSVWSVKVSIPTAITNASAGVIGGKLYVVGGQSASDDFISLVQVFDPANESWMTITPLPTARRGAAVYSLDGKLYILGGESPSGFQNTMNIYTATEY